MGRWVGAGIAVALSGCGLRSDPLFEGVELDDEGEVGESADDGPSGGACESPVAMPDQTMFTVKGDLEGRNRQGGWCGKDDGPEIVYELLAPYNTDISLTLLSSDVPLTLRVEEDACGDDDAAKICATDFDTGSPTGVSRHFLAQGGRTYYITIDTDDPDGGKFEFQVLYGWPVLTECPVHDTPIIQEPGGSFQWFNDFGRSQGDADGLCGGAGRENMFYVQTSYVGNMYVDVVGADGFEPVISIRTNCAAVSELVCEAGGANSSINASWFIDSPGEVPGYYVAVDQVGYEGGSYELYVAFD